MAIDMFLKLDSVTGESTDSSHAGEIEVASFSHSVSNQSTVGSGWSPTMITGKQIRRMMTGALLVFNASTYFGSFFSIYFPIFRRSVPS